MTAVNKALNSFVSRPHHHHHHVGLIVVVRRNHTWKVKTYF